MPFEGPFVRSFVSLEAVKAAMTPIKPCRDIQACTAGLPRADGRDSRSPFYEMQKAGGMVGEHPAGAAFAVARVAAGASELRDLTVAAWTASARAQVGYPAIAVDEVVTGGLDPYDALYGND